FGLTRPETGAEVVGEPVTPGEEPVVAAPAGALRRGAEKSPLQEPDDRRVVVEIVVYISASCVGRRHDRRHSEARLAEVLEVVDARSCIGHDRRMQVVEEATPLVVDEHEHAAVPLRWDEGAEDGIDEPQRELDGAVRVTRAGTVRESRPHSGPTVLSVVDRRGRWAARGRRWPSARG